MTTIEFNTAIVYHNKLLKGFAYSLTRSEEDASDLVQETFLKALNCKNQFTNKTNLKGWLFTIMKNTFINKHNRSKKGFGIMNEIKCTSTLFYNNIDTFITLSDIQNSISQLNEKSQIPFLKFVEGFKYEEIALELGLPLGTVKSRIFSARTQLMTLLNDIPN